MDNNKRLEELEEMERKIKARNKYQNEFQKSKYDRIAVLLPKGYKPLVDKAIQNKGYRTITEYIKYLIDKDLNMSAAPDVVADHEQIKPLILECPEIESDYDALDTYRPIRTPEELQKPTETLEERLERLKKEFGTPEE